MTKKELSAVKNLVKKAVVDYGGDVRPGFFEPWWEKNRERLLAVDPLRGKYRNTIEDLVYFGSDYNKFLATDCDRNMLVNNIDAIQMKLYATDQPEIRFIEYKHSNEGWGKGQRKGLEFISNMCQNMNDRQSRYLFNTFVVRGDAPFRKFTEASNCHTQKKHVLTYKDLVDFSSFRFTF